MRYKKHSGLYRGYEPFPMWAVMLYLGIPIGLVLIGVGIVARKMWDWRHRAEVA